MPKAAKTPEQAHDIVKLCSDVFHIDYAYYMNLDLSWTHVLGYHNGQLVTHVLWLERRMRVGDRPWLRAAYVEGMATHPDYRRRGYGSAVMRRLLQEINGYDMAALSPSRAEWYERLGWERWHGQLYIQKGDDIQATPHENVVIYRTPRSLELNIDTHEALTGEWRPYEPW